jgi:antitoxin (DNA-binding transcriptional repressor) of toxin-antitoxin stability system
MRRTINAKELRASLPEIVRRVRRGERFTVLYRSRAAFQVVPVSEAADEPLPLEEDPIYGARAVGYSTDGKTSADHDAILYDSE